VDFNSQKIPVYKYNGIPFDAHLARSLILILSVKFSSRNGDIFKCTEKAQLLPRLVVYINIKMFCTSAHWKKMLIVEISLVSQYNSFLQWFLSDITYYTFNTIYWRNIFSKTNTCICFTEIKHKTFLWNKAHYAKKHMS